MAHFSHNFFLARGVSIFFFFLGKSTTVLELEHNVMDFLLATDTPYINDYQEPKAIIGKQNNVLNRGNKK